MSPTGRSQPLTYICRDKDHSIFMQSTCGRNAESSLVLIYFMMLFLLGFLSNCKKTAALYVQINWIYNLTAIMNATCKDLYKQVNFSWFIIDWISSQTDRGRNQTA